MLRKWREELELSQEAFAHRADIDRNYVGAVERGETNLSFEGVWQFLHALGKSWAEFGHALDREAALKARPSTRGTSRSRG